MTNKELAYAAAFAASAVACIVLAAPAMHFTHDWFAYWGALR